MKKLGTLLWITALLSTFPTGAPAAGTPWKQPYDTLQWGKSGSTSNKALVFDFGLGASNPSLFSDNATKSLNYNKDGILFGDGTSSTKTLTANLGLGASNPKLDYDPAASSWGFSNDGTNFTPIGTGGGGAGVNLLTNGGFESGVTQDWTHTGGTFVSASPLIGNKSATFTASAGGQSFQSGLHAPLGLSGTGCLASFYYTGGDSNLSAEVLDDLGNVLSGPQAITAATTMTPLGLPFLCPASPRTVQAKVLSGASAAAITVDGFVLGQNAGQQVSQASSVGAIKYPKTSSCVWTNSGGSWVDYSAVSNCTTPVGSNVVGSASAPSTKIPAIKFASLPAGDYYVVATGMFVATAGGGGTDVGFRFHDGTNPLFGEGRLGTGNGIQASSMTLTGRVSYTTAQSNITIGVQSQVNAGSTSAQVYADLNDFTISVYRFPTQSEQAVNADRLNPYVDAYISGTNFSLGTSGSATKAPIEDASATIAANTGSQSVQIPCSGTNPSTGATCAVGNESLGIVFNAPAAGVWTACVDFSQSQGFSAASTVAQNFYLVETPNNAQTILQGDDFTIDTSKQSGSTGTLSFSNSFCKDFSFTSAGQKTLRMIFTQAITGTVSQNIVLADGTADRKVHIRAYPKNAQTPTPVFPGSVFSPSSGQERMVRAIVDNSGVVTGSSGSWINGSCVVSGTSVRTCPFVVGTFSGTPVCVASIADSTASAEIGVDVTSSQVVVKTYNTGVGTPFAFPFSVICMGPK